MVVLLDNGHGVDTKGKRSPDGSLREWQYTRERVQEIHKVLTQRGVKSFVLVPEENDISLSTRVARANEFCRKFGTKNVCLVSIHCNASGMGEWKTAKGWSVWTSRGQTQGDKLADELYAVATKVFAEEGRKVLADKSDKDGDWESNFTILAKTKCSACLVENFFMDNKDDLAYLQSEGGKDAIVDVVVQGVINYINKYDTK